MQPTTITFSPKPSFAPPTAGLYSAEDRGAAPAKPLRLLIVEDDYLAAADAEAGLGDAGFEIVGIARSASEAILMARTEKPALIIMDIRLAGSRDGIEAALEIFRDFAIRSIFATAHHDAAMRARAAPAQPLGWMPKPYAMHSLVALVKSAAAEIEKD